MPSDLPSILSTEIQLSSIASRHPPICCCSPPTLLSRKSWTFCSTSSFIACRGLGWWCHDPRGDRGFQCCCLLAWWNEEEDTWQVSLYRSMFCVFSGLCHNLIMLWSSSSSSRTVDDALVVEIMAQIRFPHMPPEILVEEVEGHPIMQGEVRLIILIGSSSRSLPSLILFLFVYL